MSIAAGFPPIAASSFVPSAKSAASTQYVAVAFTVPNGARFAPSCASMTSITASFSQAARKFGGRMTWSKSDSPSDNENIENATGGGATGFGGSTIFGGAKTASPTASECAQMRPHRRDSVQVQVFSMSVFDVIRRPERNSTSAPRTRPTSSGGS